MIADETICLIFVLRSAELRSQEVPPRRKFGIPEGSRSCGFPGLGAQHIPAVNPPRAFLIASELTAKRKIFNG